MAYTFCTNILYINNTNLWPAQRRVGKLVNKNYFNTIMGLLKKCMHTQFVMTLKCLFKEFKN